ncbi:MAG: SCO family protein, partial [Deltaproteobacteria bacterium]|nr:SCO family protein [Deltaproteobacteria bacterium]
MKFLLLRFLFLIFALWNLNAFSAESLPVELQDVGINEHLGQNLDLNLSFKNELGQDVLLKDYFDGKTPVVLTLVYYQCPNLCNFLLNGFNETLKKMPWTPGKEFKIVTLSIDPK